METILIIVAVVAVAFLLFGRRGKSKTGSHTNGGDLNGNGGDAGGDGGDGGGNGGGGE
ncbi:MAG: hypothetical protein ACE5IR_28955 [bacterium]